jgi:hypothetical protein
MVAPVAKGLASSLIKTGPDMCLIPQTPVKFAIPNICLGRKQNVSAELCSDYANNA